MEIKNDVQGRIKLEQLPLDKKSSTNVSTNQASAADSGDEVEIKLSTDNLARSKKLEKANVSINSLVVTNENVKKLSEIVSSVKGIVELTSTNRTETEKVALSKEVDQLAKEATNVTINLRSLKISTVPEEAARLEIEQKLAQVLDVFLPDPPKNCNEINISNKEAIIQTRAVVAKAQARIEALRNSLKSSLERATDYIEEQKSAKKEAIPTNEPEEAFKLSQVLGQSIKGSPNSATSALGRFELYSRDV